MLLNMNLFNKEKLLSHDYFSIFDANNFSDLLKF